MDNGSLFIVVVSDYYLWIFISSIKSSRELRRLMLVVGRIMIVIGWIIVGEEWIMVVYTT